MYSRANADRTNPKRYRVQHLCFSPDILKSASNMERVFGTVTFGTQPRRLHCRNPGIYVCYINYIGLTPHQSSQHNDKLWMQLKPLHRVKPSHIWHQPALSIYVTILARKCICASRLVICKTGQKQEAKASLIANLDEFLTVSVFNLKHQTH